MHIEQRRRPRRSDSNREWPTTPRWDGHPRDYTRGRRRCACAARCAIEHTLARARRRAALGAAARASDYVARARRADRQPGRADGARPGCKAIYLSRLAGRGRRQPRRRRCIPTRASTRRTACRRVVRAHQQGAAARRPDRARRRATTRTYWFAPIVADAEAGFGGPLNAFELMKAMIEAGAAGVHFEDQLASEKKCGHLGGKVLVPTSAVHPHADRRAARRRRDGRADASLVARTDADARDAAHQRRRRARPARSSPASARPRASSACTAGSSRAIARGARLRAVRRPLWCETSTPDLDEARRVRRGDPRAVPGQAARLQLLAVVQLEASTSTTRRSRSFQRELGAMGYKFQFVTLAGFHALNHVDVRAGARLRASAAWRPTSELQEREFAREARRLHRDAPPARGRHRLLRRGRRRRSPAATRSTLALEGSTEEAQFEGEKAPAWTIVERPGEPFAVRRGVQPARRSGRWGSGIAIAPSSS